MHETSRDSIPSTAQCLTVANNRRQSGQTRQSTPRHTHPDPCIYPPHPVSRHATRRGAAILTGLSSVTAPLAAPLGVRKNNETTSRNNSLILNSNARNKYLCSPAFSRIDACQHNHRYETTEQKGGRDEHCSSRPPIGAHAPRVLFAISGCGAWRPRGTDPRWRQCQPGRPGQPHQYRSSPAAEQATV